VLIDFDNILPPGEGSLSAELLSHQLVGLLKSALVTHPSLEHFVIRLYGGWYEGGTLTNRGSEVAQLVSQVDLFPLAIRGKGSNRIWALRCLLDELLAAESSNQRPR
jgi:hypothetical protein